MSASPATKPAHLAEDHARAIASLSEKLHLPFHEVRQAYLKELDRLKAQARIHSFLEVLAFSSTRSALSCGKKPRSTDGPRR
ncbi:MAG: hypothetical protein KGL45_15490 [Gammaproteobacteria bacterium]|nr:hypothetical protein [Gammaproteobacteria bacterium]